MKRKKQKDIKFIVSCLLIVIIICYNDRKKIISYINNITKQQSFINHTYYSIDQIPEYKGMPYIILNNNKPNFTKEDYNTNSFEKYSELDYLNRCGVAFANIGIEMMPTEKRGSIGMIKPSGWHTIKYNTVNGKYLYNRCHLIGYQLTGENANEKNLITCTRYMNTTGMLEFENQVANYIKETRKNVLYRVTPIFEKENLVANGVEIEASSVEDHCEKICFHVYIYNVQEGIEINYKTGESKIKSVLN